MLSETQISIQKMFLLPVIFFVWSIWSILTHLFLLDFAFGGFLMGSIIGFTLSYTTHKLVGVQSKYIKSINLFEIQGSILPLIMILIAFFSKFALLAYLATHQSLTHSFYFCTFFGLISGFVSSLFWGRFFYLILPLYKKSFSQH